MKQTKTSIVKTDNIGIEKYQCPGCGIGSSIKCGHLSQESGWGGVECSAHVAGTTIMRASGIHRLFLGMPKGFNRCGNTDNTKIVIFKTLNDYGQFDHWNIPVWKYLNEFDHTLIRVFSPRVNQSTIVVFLENCVSLIDCFEVSKKMIDGMD